MSGVKIGPPGGPPKLPSLQGEERAAPAGQTRQEAPAGGAEAAASGISVPASLVEQVRSGQLDPAEAVERLIDHALEAPLAEGASEEQREEIRRAIGELVREDPTLAALAQALKR